ncbi:MAG: DUF362 domain-containing protein [Erysipelotrichaceae bacterium]|nr:DUF362 domain-containing protein [Erysipelotrichaceae bacterium]
MNNYLILCGYEDIVRNTLIQGYQKEGYVLLETVGGLFALRKVKNTEDLITEEKMVHVLLSQLKGRVHDTSMILDVSKLIEKHRDRLRENQFQSLKFHDPFLDEIKTLAVQTLLYREEPMMTKEEANRRYVPMEERTGNESIVYFTRDLSPEGLKKAYEKVNGNIDKNGKVAIKLHTGEPHGPNIIPSAWIKKFMEDELPNATIVETNTFYDGDRYTTEQHRETLKVNGWTFCPVDIMDEEGTVCLPVKGGKWFKEMSHGSHMTNYDNLVVLTHFKGHTMGGFGGSNKNIGIGCADGRIGKAWIHAKNGNDWGVVEEELMEKITESTKATIDYFGEKVTYVNVMRNMSVSCDCEGVAAAPVVTPNVGILASTDILAIDQACVDLVYAMTEEEHHDLVERIETRHGLRQLSYMKEMKMGNNRYILIDLDNDEVRICPKDAVKDLKPFVAEKIKF